MLACKVFGFGKLTRLHSDRFTKHDLTFHDKNGFPISALHMNVDWGVVVAVEEEFESVFGEYCRHTIFSYANVRCAPTGAVEVMLK